MQAKNFFKVTLFAVIMCTLLVVCAMAAELDAKIARWDGNGNITVTSSKTHSTENGYFHREDTVTSDGRFTLTVSASDVFTLYDYPFIKIKYRSNYPKSIQLYFGSGNQHYTNLQDVSGTTVDPLDGDWHVAELSYKGTTSITNFTAKDGTTRAARCAGANPIIPSEATPVNVNSMLVLPRDAAASDSKFYLDIEYIAFFKTQEDMQAYDSMGAQIMRFDGYANVKTSALTTAVDNGSTVGKVALSAGKDNTTYVTISSENNYFYLNDYPYAALKFNTNLPVDDTAKAFDAQFYISDHDWVYDEANDTNKLSRLGYYINYLENSNPKLSKNTWYTNEYYYPNNGQTTAQAYTSTDGRTNSVSFTGYGDATANKVFPSATKKVVVSSPFFQFKGADVASTDYVLLDYMAFFNTESAMKSYVADHNSVTSAIATAASKSYTVTKHQAQDCVFIEDTVEAVVAQYIGAGYEIAVNVKNYKTGDTSTTANIIIRKNDAVKATAVNVEIVNAWEFGLETLGAQVRADAGDGKGQGLRFGTKLDTANIPEGATVVEYGTVIGKAGSTPVVNGANMATVKAVNLFEEAVNYVVYTAVVTNIPDKQMATKIVARPYVIYSVGETSYTYYGEAITRSIQEVIDASADGWDK